MKATPSVLAFGSLLTVFGASTAKAEAQQVEQVALNFELPPAQAADSARVIEPLALLTVPENGPAPLPIPAGAANPPMRSHSAQQLPAGVYRQAVASGLNAGQSPAAILPPAPPLVRTLPVVAQTPSPGATPATAAEPEAAQSIVSDTAVLSFDIMPLGDAPIAQDKTAPQLPANPLASLFEGGTDSLVARAVGSAEGTRTPSGGITSAYYGHSDPGNGVWNMGTFSYQHGAKSAGEADQKQLERLQAQSQVLKNRAAKHGLNLTLEETLNGIDLANQSPLASIGRVGYIERLAEAHQMGYTGYEAIVVARTRSYLNPDTNRWNAPGLGNTLNSITRDQRRRADAVAQAIAIYQQDHAQVDWQYWSLMPSAELNGAVLAEQPQVPDWKPEDIVFNVWTDGTEKSPPEEVTAAGSNPDALTATAVSPGSESSRVLEVPLLRRGEKPGFSVKVPQRLARFAQLVPADTASEVTAANESGDEPGSAAVRDAVATAQPASGQGERVVSQRANQPLTFDGVEIPKTAPTWQETREANQTLALQPDQRASGVAQSLPINPPGSADSTVWGGPQSAGSVPEPMPPTSPGSTDPNGLISAQPIGAVPETTVLPSLRADHEPVTPPSLIPPADQPGEISLPVGGKSEKEKALFTAPSLPEGMVNQLQAQGDLAEQDEDESAKPPSLRDQIAEAILGVDLSASGRE